MGDMERIAYGSDPSQFAELTRPSGASRGVVVVIHGGFWRAQYDLSLGRPLAASLAEEGWTAWNLEYRRVGNGGGWPQTPDDVSAGIDKLAEVDGLDLSRVVTLGHSAGGHLAVWAAGRQRLQPWTDAKVPVTAAVSQAGVLDLAGAASLGAGAVEAFLGRCRRDAHARRRRPLRRHRPTERGVGDDGAAARGPVATTSQVQPAASRTIESTPHGR